MGKKIGIYEFQMLSTSEKADYLWEMGIFLETALEKGKKYQLYSLIDFYVEVEYDPKENKIKDFRPFRSQRAIAFEKYLEQLDLSKLLTNKD